MCGYNSSFRFSLDEILSTYFLKIHGFATFRKTTISIKINRLDSISRGKYKITISEFVLS